MDAEKAGLPSIWGVRRLWNLADMMNFVLSHYLSAVKNLDSLIAYCALKEEARGIPQQLMSQEDKGLVTRDLRIVVDACRQMSLTTADKRINRIAATLSADTSYLNMTAELKVLKQAIDDDVMYERFYHYPKDLAESHSRVELDWHDTLAAFPSPSMKFEITSAVDCYALGHPTASIFHFMRVVELGLRTLAKERRVRVGNKPIEWATWQTILQKLEDARIKILREWAAGARKDAALGFYAGALAGLHSFKDQYRNMVMHYRGPYEMEDAAKVMRQVRDFMNEISKRVGESTTGSIKRWV